MAKTKSVLVLVLAGLGLVSGCGRKGPILPPLDKTPQTVKNLACRQTGGTLHLTWESPQSTVDGLPLGPEASVEIYMALYPIMIEKVPPAGKPEDQAEEEPASSGGEGPPAGFDFNRESYLLAIVRRSRDEGPEPESQQGLPQWFDLELDKQARPEYFSKGLVFAARVRDGRRRRSAFSEPCSFRPRILPHPPGNLNFFIGEGAVTIVWDPPEDNFDGSAPAAIGAYNLYRSQSGKEYRKLNEKPIKETRFEDKNFVFGSTYFYALKALPDADSANHESRFSDALEVMVKDTFPPAPPTGLDFISGAGLISLSWKVGAERDLAGYKIYRRRAGTGEFAALTARPVMENAYNDTTAERGIRYEYAVAAVDSSGNESGRSAVIQAVLR
jgi:predicted small lipoprotein YifL